MGKNKMLASIFADASRIEDKLNNLFEMLPKHVLDELLRMIPSLLDNITLVDCTTTIGTCGSFNVICALDFSPASYDEVMAAARALKVDFAHQKNP